jgi:hypothetical protein
MNGAEHFKSSEACLLEADRSPAPESTGYLLAAQAHALLAVAAAIVQPQIAVLEALDSWREALS